MSASTTGNTAESNLRATAPMLTSTMLDPTLTAPKGSPAESHMSSRGSLTTNR